MFEIYYACCNDDFDRHYLYSPSHVKGQEVIEFESLTCDTGLQRLDDHFVNTPVLEGRYLW